MLCVVAKEERGRNLEGTSEMMIIRVIIITIKMIIITNGVALMFMFIIVTFMRGMGEDWEL